MSEMKDNNSQQPVLSQGQNQDGVNSPTEDDMSLALRLSQEQESERQERMRREEEEILRQVLELSLKEK